ncbi:MAG TPA: lysylphosphatidylglycerol synthase domain-containing protein [Candidatus Dormibacteraeota bacterium]
MTTTRPSEPIEPTVAPRRSAVRWLRLAAVPVVTVGLLWYFLHRLPPGTIADSYRHASPAPLAISVAAVAVFMAARAWRYRILLGAGATAAPPAGPTAAVTVAAWWPGLLLPGIAADAAFVYLAGRRLDTTLVRAGGAAVAARVLDVVSLLAIGLVTAPLAGARLPWFVWALATLALVASVALMAGLRRRRFRAPLLALLARVPGGKRIGARAERALEELGGGRHLVGLVVATALARVATAVQYTALFAALGVTVTIWQAWFALSFRTLLLAIPIQGLAGLGTTQLWWTAALTVMGFPAQRAETVGFQIHLLDLSVVVPASFIGGAVLLLVYRRRKPS